MLKLKVRELSVATRDRPLPRWANAYSKFVLKINIAFREKFFCEKGWLLIAQTASTRIVRRDTRPTVAAVDKRVLKIINKNTVQFREKILAREYMNLQVIGISA